MSASNESDTETVKTLLSLAPEWFMLMPSADNLQSVQVQKTSELTGVTDDMLRALLALPGCLTVAWCYDVFDCNHRQRRHDAGYHSTAGWFVA